MSLLDDKICDLYVNQRMSCARIAEIDGRSEGTIYNILKAKNIRFRTRSEANKECPDRVIIKLYNLGLSSAQIGRLLGFNPSTVTKRLERCGFPTRTPSSARLIGYNQQEFDQLARDISASGYLNHAGEVDE